MRKTVLAIALIVAVSAGACFSQEQEGGPSITVGAAAGLMWFPETESLSTLGAAIGFSLTPPLAINVSYWHAGISFLGVSLLSVDVFDISLQVDLSHAERFGIYLAGGGSFVLAGSLGEGISGIAGSAALGLRVSPADILRVFIEYHPLIRNGLLHVIQGGISLVF